MTTTVAYLANPNWYRFLHSRNITDLVNFWRKDLRRIRWPIFSVVYFVLPGARRVVGRGSFSMTYVSTPEEVWHCIDIRNGFDSLESFKDELRRIYGWGDEERRQVIRNIILMDVEWLSPGASIRMDPTLIPPKLSTFKILDEEQAERLDASFEAALSESDEATVPLDLDSLEEEITSLQKTQGALRMKMLEQDWNVQALHSTTDRHEGRILDLKRKVEVLQKEVHTLTTWLAALLVLGFLILIF